MKTFKQQPQKVMDVVKLNVGGELFTTTKATLIGTGTDAC
jgi:hypothetical protein